MGQMHRKKFIVTALICMIFCLLPVFAGLSLPPFLAVAEPTEDPLADQRFLDINFSVKPGEMVAPGDATMTFVIANKSDYAIQNIYLSSADGLLSEPIGQIGAGETQTLVRSHMVTQDELDEGVVSYYISHDPVDGGTEKISYTVSAPIIKSDPKPEVDFTRQISSDYISKGSLVTITYKICNTGNVPVEAIRIRDSLGDFTGRLEALDVGDAKIFISRVTINDEAVSEPVLEYTVPSGDTVSRKLDQASIHLSTSALDSSFSVGKSVFDEDTADAILTLTNAGNSDYTDITILDDIYGGVIADSITLPKGGNPVEVAYTYAIRGEAKYRWRITGRSESGEMLDFVTDTMTLGDSAGTPEIAMSITATPRTPKISHAGRVTFDIAIENKGTVMAQNVLLYEISRGEVRTLAVLPTGEPTQCTVSYDVQTDSQFIFCLNYADAAGHSRTVSTAPINVEIGPGGELPEQPGESPALSGDSVKIGASSTFKVLLIAVGAILLAMLLVLMITSRRVRRVRRERLAAEKQRLKEELGKTNRFTPLKRLDKDKK